MSGDVRRQPKDALREIADLKRENQRLRAVALTRIKNLSSNVLGFAQVTSNVGSITATSVVLVDTPTITLPPNRLIKLTGTWRSWTSTAALDRVRIVIASAAVANIRNEQIHKIPDAATEQLGNTLIGVFDSGAGGSTVCRMNALRHSGSGTITFIAAAEYPLTILVEDIGPS